MDLELYHRWGCPYSDKVRTFIDENEIGNRIKLIEIDEADGAIETLMRLNQKAQVPCLLINGKPLLESKDIINWLDLNVIGSTDSLNA